MVVCQPENFLTWGGALLPRVETLEPRIRETALYRFYLPKLVEEGFQDPDVLRRVTAAALGTQHPGVNEVARNASLASVARAGEDRKFRKPGVVPQLPALRRCVTLPPTADSICLQNARQQMSMASTCQAPTFLDRLSRESKAPYSSGLVRLTATPSRNSTPCLARATTSRASTSINPTPCSSVSSRSRRSQSESRLSGC